MRSNQLDKKQALRLLIPNEKGRKSLFQKAKGSNWGIIANWTNEEGINFSNMLPRLTASELEDMVEIARKGQWEEDKVHALLCKEDKEKNIFLSRLPFKTQQEVSFWNQETTNKNQLLTSYRQTCLPQILVNKNTKCPIDAHCHRHCRKDSRITKDWEVLQVLSF